MIDAARSVAFSALPPRCRRAAIADADAA